MKKVKRRAISIEIGKLTNSILEVKSNKKFDTEVSKFTKEDSEKLNPKDWTFNWKKEYSENFRRCEFYKLTITGSSQIHGLIELFEERNVIIMPLIENIKFNQGRNKRYEGVPGNLVAFACKLSMNKGYEGWVSFEAKTNLIEHYKKTLGAHVIHGIVMAIGKEAAMHLIKTYKL